MKLLRLPLTSLLAVAVSTVPPIAAQDAQAPIIEAQFAEANGITLVYFAFGDAGMPVVWVQDHHDYFRAATFGQEQAEEWVAFLERFADSFRVLAPVRRGWGASGDPGHGFDVATQSEDILGLLDALGIDRAVFVGRTLATQELTWIAEHHPERVIGLVYLDTPMVWSEALPPDPEVERFAAMYDRMACDIGGGGEEATRRLRPRGAYRAHFMDDPDLQIDIPTLLHLHPLVDRQGMNLRRLGWLERLAEDNDCGDDEAKAYFGALAQDESRLAHLRRAFTGEAEALDRVRDAMRRAFGDRLTVVWGPDEFGLEPWYSDVRPFLEGLAGR